MQNFIFAINSNSRAGAEPAFTNITLDITPDRVLADSPAMWKGMPLTFEGKDICYKDCQEQIDMINKAFCEIMVEGDAAGKPFSYPIPTYNIHDRFDWDNKKNDPMWEMAGKYGIPYFANFLNSDMKPEDVRSMCCRLRISTKEISKKNGGYFGAGDNTGSIGVGTINLPQLAYLAEDEVTFFDLLEKALITLKDSLEIKRKFIQEKVLDAGLVPAFMQYVGTIRNHFSTIGYIGMNEMCENFYGVDILDPKGKEFAEKVCDFINDMILKFQEETGNLYNFEASPAESTCYRLAKKDKEKYPKIKTAGNTVPYYTNSCHMPVDKVEGIKQLFDHQESLQVKHSGGTVNHIYLDSSILGEQAKEIVRATCTSYKVPYISLSPLNRSCPEHGYQDTKSLDCPICGKPLRLFQRITGYIREVSNFNAGKGAEFADRKQISHG